MPPRKKHQGRNKFLFWLCITILVILMIIYFEPNTEMTEIILWP